MDERGAIQDQISRYTDAVNRRDWASFPTIFHRDASWQAIGFGDRLDGLDAITAGISGLVEAMTSFIQINSPSVIEIDGDRAVARCSIHELGRYPGQEKLMDICGRYEDELVKTDGRWLFASRRFTGVIVR